MAEPKTPPNSSETTQNTDTPRSDTRKAAYPEFPQLREGDVTAVRVFRLVAQPKGPPRPQRLAWRWNPGTLTRDDVVDLYGGGTFRITAYNGGQILGNVTFDAEGPAREPSPEDTATQRSADETPGGWVTIPGQRPEINLAMVSYQQAAHQARDGELKATAAMFGVVDALLKNQSQMMESFAELAKAPLAAVEMMRGELANLRAHVQHIDTDNKRLLGENRDLTIREAKHLTPGDTAWAKAGEAAVGAVEAFVGTVAQNMAGSAAKGANPLGTPGANGSGS